MSNTFSELPFDLDLCLPREGQDAQLTINFVRGAPDPEDQEETTLAPCDEVLHVFSLAQGSRMLSGGPGAPRPTVMDTLSKHIPDGGSSWIYQFQVREVEPASFLVLLALLAQTKYAYAPLAAVTIQASVRDGSTMNARELLELPRKVVRVSPPPFTVEQAQHQSRKRRLVTFRFRDPVRPDVFEEIAEQLNVWDHLAVLGGFLFDFQEQDQLPPFGEPAHIAPRVIEHRVQFYDGDESGFNALVNLAAALHAGGRPLTSMEME